MSAIPPLGLPIQPVPAATPSRPAAPASSAAIAKAARDFEAMAIGQLLQPMFDTVDTAHGAFGGGEGEEAWKPMLVQEIAKQIEANGGLGLARPVYEAMLHMQEANSKNGG
jgi:Rod binding domain-containing protein